MPEQPNKPRIYLDIDGVIIADNSPFEQVELNRIERYAPEVAQRLGNTGLELVWLSSWGTGARHLSEVIEPFKDARVLSMPWASDPFEQPAIERKLATLLTDQAAALAPFVWVDDMLSEKVSQIVTKCLRVPQLLVQPNSRMGLTNADLVQIEAFTKNFL